MADSLTRLPKALYRAEDVQKLDSLAINQYGRDGFELMQFAATVAFQTLLERWPQVRFIRVFAGSGNNAGDGFLCSALAKENAIPCEVVLVGDPEKLGPDANQAYQRAAELGVEMTRFTDFKNSPSSRDHPVVVDALLGTGIDREVDGHYRDAIAHISESAMPVLAIDIPSGLSADTGMPLGIAVTADTTVTFIGLKQGMLTGRGRDHCGDIVFHNLDISEQVYSDPNGPAPSARRIDINSVTHHLAPRKASSHKGSNGHVVVVGGDTNFGGAAIMCAEAAIRAGAGLVSVVSRSCHRPAALTRRPELMWLGTEDENTTAATTAEMGNKISDLLARASVIVIGPGLGRGAWSQKLFNQVLSASMRYQTPLVIDADGLHLLADRFESAPLLSRHWVLTPHPGEAAVLLNQSTDSIQKDRFAAVAALATRFGGSCLLKGSGSLIAHGNSPHGQAQIVELCSEGNPGMGTGGMGDVLAGLVGSLIGQGIPVSDSLSAGVCIHGEAGDLAALAQGERGLVATDLLPWIRQLVNPSVLPH